MNIILKRVKVRIRLSFFTMSARTTFLKRIFTAISPRGWYKRTEGEWFIVVTTLTVDTVSLNMAGNTDHSLGIY